MKIILLLLAFVAVVACQKEECKSCYVLEGRRNVKDSLIVTETDAGMKCGDDIQKWTKTPWVNTRAYTKVNKCR